MHQEQSKDPAGRGTLLCPRAAFQLCYGKTKVVHHTWGQLEQPKVTPPCAPLHPAPHEVPGSCSAKCSADTKEGMSGLRG